MMFGIFAFVVAPMALTHSWPGKHTERRHLQPVSVRGWEAFGGLGGSSSPGSECFVEGERGLAFPPESKGSWNSLASDVVTH